MFNVYYLDDEADLCEAFEDAYASDQIKVKTFSDPKAFVEAVNVEPPDLIIVDYRLPGTTGDVVVSGLPASIPKYLVTGDLSTNIKYPFVKILDKPVKMQTMNQILNQYLR